MALIDHLVGALEALYAASRAMPRRVMAVSVELFRTEVAALRVLFDDLTYSKTPKALEDSPVVVVVLLADVPVAAEPEIRELLAVPLPMLVRYITTESATTVYVFPLDGADASVDSESTTVGVNESELPSTGPE